MKKIVSIIMSLVLVFVLGVGTVGEMKVRASDEIICIDGSYLLNDETESTGDMEISTYGYYLKSGTSTLSEISTGKIGVGGSTTAQRIVDEISVTVVVQRLENGSWKNYHTWTAEKTDAAYVSTSKTLTVATGYYYRVCCSHYAATDAGSSNTNALYID